ncbi:MAG TPA: helix-turn-helix domain-containing protein [Actinocrinis sp.]|jgi:AcrR family transcriptional regulator
MTGAAPRRGRPTTGVREALLAAAEAVVSESGAARLSTKEVARRAGVAESSIFYHFGDRAGLLEAVVWQHLPPVLDLFGDGPGGHEGGLRENLVALFEALEALFLRVVPVMAVLQADGQVREGFIERSRETGIGPHHAIAGTAGFLAAERDAGRIRPDADLRAAAMLLVGGAYQRALQTRLGAPDAPRWLAAPGETVDALLRGLDATGPAGPAAGSPGSE